jgi:hypothetical protein
VTKLNEENAALCAELDQIKVAVADMDSNNQVPTRRSG